MNQEQAPQRRFEILDQHNERVRVLHAPGMDDSFAVVQARDILHAGRVRADGILGPDRTRFVTAVRVVEFGCDPKTGERSPTANLGAAPAGGYIVSRLVYDSDQDEPGPLDVLCAAVRKAIEAYDATQDHKHALSGPGDCIRCALARALPASHQRLL
jgi:hypothetical protein